MAPFKPARARDHGIRRRPCESSRARPRSTRLDSRGGPSWREFIRRQAAMLARDCFTVETVTRAADLLRFLIELQSRVHLAGATEKSERRPGRPARAQPRRIAPRARGPAALRDPRSRRQAHRRIRRALPHRGRRDRAHAERGAEREGDRRARCRHGAPRVPRQAADLRAPTPPARAARVRRPRQPTSSAPRAWPRRPRSRTTRAPSRDLDIDRLRHATQGQAGRRHR
jgi:hypothetical protein